MKIKTIGYQTARDLPFAEAGTKVELSLSEGCIPMSLYNIKDCEVTISKEFIGQLLCEGWIKSAESVKPREWYMIKNKFGAVIQLVENRCGLLRTNIDEEIVKVREVIE